MNKEPVLKGVTWCNLDGGDLHSWPLAAPCSARYDWHEVPPRGARRYGHDWRGWSWARWSKAFALAPARSVWSAYECVCQRRSLGSFSFRLLLCLSRCPCPFQPLSVLLWGYRKDTKNKTQETVGHKKEKNKSTANVTKRNNLLEAMQQRLFAKPMNELLYKWSYR